MKNLNLLKLLNFIVILAGLTSCAGFDHRDFEDEMSEWRDDDLAFIPNQDFPVVAGDEGDFGGGMDVIISRTPGYKPEKKELGYDESIKVELEQKEMRLDEAEQRDYLQYRNKLGNDSARIYYLSLDSREKYEYLLVRGIVKPERDLYYSRNERAIASLSNDITLGMTKNDVSKIWGQPGRVDYSGSRSDENERWAYRKGDKVKFIYFDGGIVEGWTEE